MMSEKNFYHLGIKKNEALRTFFNGKINFDKYLVEFYGVTLAR